MQQRQFLAASFHTLLCMHQGIECLVVEEGGGVVLQYLQRGLLQELVQILAGSQDGVVKPAVHVGIVVAFELLFDYFVVGGQVGGVYILRDGGQHGFGHGTLYFVVVVFVVDAFKLFLQLRFTSFQQRVVFLFQCLGQCLCSPGTIEVDGA